MQFFRTQSISRIFLAFVAVAAILMTSQVVHGQSYMEGWAPPQQNYPQGATPPDPIPTSCTDEVAYFCAIPPGCENTCTGTICASSCKLKAPKTYTNKCHALRDYAMLLHQGTCTSTSSPLMAVPPIQGIVASSSNLTPTIKAGDGSFTLPVPAGGIGTNSSAGTLNVSGAGMSQSMNAYGNTNENESLCSLLNKNIWSGSSVTKALQDFLREQGFFTYSSTGYFGPLTRKALTDFQMAKGIIANAQDGGVFGPKTRRYILNNHCSEQAE